MNAEHNRNHLLSYSSSDAEETRAIVTSVYCDHDMRAHKPGLNYRHQLTAGGAVSLSTMSYGEAVDIRPRSFPGFYLVQMPLAGHDRQTLGRQELYSDVRTASLHAPGSEPHMRWSSQCRKFVARFERQALEQHAALMLDTDPQQPLPLPALASVEQPVFRSWLDMASHIYRQLQQTPQLLDAPLVKSQFEQTLMTMLLPLALDGSPGLRAPEAGRVLPRHVKRAVDYMQACPGDDISVARLAELTGVSGRTLYAGFERFMGVGPMQYLKNVRLECLRRDLLDPGQPRNVTSWPPAGVFSSWAGWPVITASGLVKHPGKPCSGLADLVRLLSKNRCFWLHWRDSAALPA